MNHYAKGKEVEEVGQAVEHLEKKMEGYVDRERLKEAIDEAHRETE